MRRKLGFAALVLAGVAALALGGVAIAQSGGDDDPAAPRAEAEAEAFLDDVAGRLDVTPARLREALRGAATARVDRALERGDITEAQAERMREAIESGALVPLLGRHGPRGAGHGHGPGGHGGPLGAGLEAATGYLDVTRAQLLERLRAGETLADVAEAEGTSVEGLEDAIVAAAEERLDAAVADEKLTRERADALLERLRGRVDELVRRSLPERMGRGGRFGFGRDG